MPERKRRKDKVQGAELDQLSRAATRNDTASREALEETKRRIRHIAATKARMSTDQRAGFVFEEYHAGTFNAAALKAGDHLTKAKTGIDAGFVNDPRVDIVVQSGKQTVAEVQAKCCGSAGRTAVSVAQPRYAGTDRLVPSDQAKAVKSALSRSAASKARSPNPSMRAKGVTRGEAAPKVTDRVKANGHSSKPISHAETQAMANGNLRVLDRMIARNRITSAAKGGATAGAAAGGVISLASNLVDLGKGKKSGADAAVAIAKDTAVSAGRGAATAILTEGVKIAGKQMLRRGAAKSLLKGSAPAAIAGCAIDMVGDAWRGELTAEKAAKNVGRAGSAWAGAALGTLIGGPIGTLVALLGGLAFSRGFSAIFD